jgi:hypothetical protein
MSKEQVAKSKVKKTPRKLVLLCSLLIANCSFVIAQDGETGLIQHLTWTEDEYARRYEKKKKKEEGGEYRELFQEFTTALFIQISLLPGKYRCRVITHDFLNRPGPVPEWKYIEVLDVMDPEAANKTDNIELDHKTDSAEPVQSEQVRLTDTQVDIFLSAAWMPSFTVSDRGNRFFKGDMSLAGVAGRFGLVWARPNFLNPGAELAVSYNAFGIGTGGRHLLAFTLNLSALKWLPGDRTALTFRLGAGYSVFLPEPAAETGGIANSSSHGSPPVNGTAHASMGISFLLFVIKHWYLETGLDYAQSLPAPSSSCFRPWLGIGYSR